MTKEEIFAIWAPEDARWSRWTKPVLFAHLDAAPMLGATVEQPPDLSWAPSADGNTALVLDLPGAEGVFAGLALAERGFRPVPLYNAVPMPVAAVVLDPIAHPTVAAVNMAPILTALKSAAERLSQLTLPAGAPPAFLLDANRRGDGRKMRPDEFDNRSVTFTTDFPSAILLASQGIRRAILVQITGDDPAPDLAHSLLRWQEGGIALERKRLDVPGPPETLRVVRPSWYGAMFQRALLALGLRRSSTGGFGAWVASSSAG